MGKTVSLPGCVRRKRGHADISGKENIKVPNGHRLDSCFELTVERLLEMSPYALFGLQAQYETYAEKNMTRQIFQDMTWGAFGISFTFTPQIVFGFKDGIRGEISSIISRELSSKSKKPGKIMFSLQSNHINDEFGEDPEAHVFGLFPQFWDSSRKFIDRFGNEEKIVTDFGDDKTKNREKIQEMADHICNYLIVQADNKDLNPVACQIIYVNKQPKLLMPALG